MAMSSGFINSTFLSGETTSLALPFSTPSASPCPRPFHLRVVRTPTLATASKQASSGKGELRGIMKPRRVSPEMQDVVGLPEISRTQALKLIWAHIKENNLQVQNFRLLFSIFEYPKFLIWVFRLFLLFGFWIKLCCSMFLLNPGIFLMVG